MQPLTPSERKRAFEEFVRTNDPLRARRCWAVLIADLLIRIGQGAEAETFLGLPFDAQESMMADYRPLLTYGNLRAKVLRKVEEAFAEAVSPFA